MKFAYDTALLCFLGWTLHWLSSWGEAWKLDKSSLIVYLQTNPPAFYFSLLSTVAVYLMGPDLLASIGVDLPENTAVKLLGAFLVGYAADSIVYKIAALTKKA